MKNELRLERLSSYITASKYTVENTLREASPRYATVPVSDLITDAAPVIARFILQQMEMDSQRSRVEE